MPQSIEIVTQSMHNGVTELDVDASNIFAATFLKTNFRIDHRSDHGPFFEEETPTDITVAYAGEVAVSAMLGRSESWVYKGRECKTYQIVLAGTLHHWQKQGITSNLYDNRVAAARESGHDLLFVISLRKAMQFWMNRGLKRIPPHRDTHRYLWNELHTLL